MLDKLQKHTVELYHLAEKKYVRQRIPARSLLTVERFDFFAKLFYIRCRNSAHRELALKVYADHIKAFNPDGKEPGRADKNGVDDFIEHFDHLIDFFEKNKFDEHISLVPLDSRGLLLDGSHRLCALAYFEKDIEILRFEDVKVVADFDYLFFQKRGLLEATADLMALEALRYVEDMHIACFWPKMGPLNQREFALDYLKTRFPVLYVKQMTMSVDNLRDFIYEVYIEQDWVGDAANGFLGAKDKAINCYALNGKVQFVLFSSGSLAEVMSAKEAIRVHYNLGKHALHITDNHKETEDIAHFILTEKSQHFQNTGGRIRDKWQGYKVIVKNVYLINLKVLVARVLKKVGLYKSQ